MKISRIECISVNVPLKPELRTKTAHGEHVTSPYVIVRVHTDDGLCGLGEATVAPRWSGETSIGCVAAINGLIAPALIGEDATQITRLTAKMNRVIKLNPFMKSGIEMALWDLAGKAADVPVYQLLGGRVRDSVPIKMVVGAFDVERSVALAERFLNDGVRCLKVKVGPNPEEDIERVRAVRNCAGPEIPIGIDANCGWSVTQAGQMLRRLAEFDILFAEQPIPVENLADMPALRRNSSIPIMADESVFTVHDAWQVARSHAADILSVYPGKHGGIQATLEIANIAKAAGIVCSMGSNLELGIATAAMLHLGVAVPAIASELYPGDFIGPLYHEADLLKKPLTLGPSAALVPDGPGLGVELDEVQLERYRDNSTDFRAVSAS
ncbi:MAG: mandelate racemase/muconate lactonizing protein [Planctomycetota bacterium]|nr:mandelate racemase/muconate lactonizing protein [Planctomycetota bacterium]MDA1248128.1 mandelate racemase/muconate lactonizing protein [Planctomycetota bacterium]